MNALRLRYILAASIAMLLLAIGFGIWRSQLILEQQMHATDHAKIDAEVSQQEVQKLKQLQVELADNKELIERAKQIAASTEAYRYQDQIIGDLTAYANRNGTSISSFDFGGAGPQGKPATDASKTAFLVSLNGPLDYNQVLQFIRDVEQNLTKIQITSITLAPDPKNAKLITNPTIGLEVFLKK